MESIILTFAELEFLLSDAPQAARERLHLRAWEADSAVSSCGAASLFARGLLNGGENSLVVDERLAPYVEALAAPAAWIEIGFARDNAGYGIQVFEAETTRVQATAHPLGTFAFTALDRTIPFAQAAGELVESFLGSDEPGAVFLKVSPVENGQALGGFALRRLASGSIEIAPDTDHDERVTEVTLEDAPAKVEQYVVDAYPSL